MPGPRRSSFIVGWPIGAIGRAGLGWVGLGLG
jgi:hypothetical protein